MARTAARGAQPARTVTVNGRFRIAALPSSAYDQDIILSDDSGRQYLLTPSDDLPQPLARSEADSLGMFFEPSQDSSWHTVPELRRMWFGAESASSLQ